MKDWWLIAVLIVGTAMRLPGQTITVVDAINLRPIEGAYVFKSGLAVVTDEFGKANLTPFSPNDTLNFQHLHYKSKSIPFQDLDRLGFEIKLRRRSLNIEEVVIAVNKWEQNRKEIPNALTAIPQQEISFQNIQTTADILQASGKVFVQKSQLGGGSPMLRGFSANRVLIVVDGVRMNNAIFRSGNLQNIISLDAHSISNAEVIFGPGSVIYGSDALGGVMDFHTLSPKLSLTDEPLFSANFLLRGASASWEKTVHADVNWGTKQWGLTTSLSFSDYEDLRMGTRRNEAYQRLEYVKTMNGNDQIIVNDRPNIQRFSGYSQWNLMQKVRFRPNRFWNIEYGLHMSRSSNVPRYDRLIQYQNGQLRSAEWFYGPQQWIMNSIQVHHTQANELYDQAKLTLAVQDYSESRHDRPLGGIWLRERTEQVNAFSANLDLDKKLSDRYSLFYGIEAIHNDISSAGVSSHIVSSDQEVISSRYPDGSSWSSLAAYVSLKGNIHPKLTLTGGLRFNHVNLHAAFDPRFFDFPSPTLKLSPAALNGNVGLVYRPASSWQFNLNLATGFRAPNIDDAAKVFDSEPGNVIVPNPNLTPEYAYNIDVGIVKTLGEKWYWELTGFYTWLDQAMVRRNTQFNGQDSILYDGVLSRVQSIVNAEQAYVFGFQFAFSTELTPFMTLKSTITYTQGETTEGEPLRHVAPAFGRSHLILQGNRQKLDSYLEYNGDIRFENLAISERNKPELYAKDSRGLPYSYNIVQRKSL